MLGVETEVETTLERRSKQPQPPTESSTHPLWEISEPLRKNVWSWPWPDCGDCQAVPWCLLLKSQITTCSACKGIEWTLPKKNIIKLKLKEIGKSSITVGWKTRPYPFVNKLQCSGLCILSGKDFLPSV